MDHSPKSKPALKAAPSKRPPLFVDLDGTLILTDVLMEQWLAFARTHPWRWPITLFWLRQGKAAFKQKLQQLMPVDATTLPYHQELLADLKQASAQGRVIYLATAADQGVAEAVAKHLNLFEDILASDGNTNLVGKRKLDAVSKRVDHAEFAYAGDSSNDLPILAKAQEAILVNPAGKVEKTSRSHGNLVRVYRPRPNAFRALAKAMRPHQWVKNILVFVPLFSAHAWNQPTSWKLAILAFFAFCAISSATYLINDLLDLHSDRRHPEKCRRPFASGALSIQNGIAAVPLLVAFGFSLAWYIGMGFFLTLLGYFVTSQAYSLYLKSLPLMDVTALAGLFTLRVFSGAYAIDVPISKWLLAFSMFLFFSLAFVKRYAELHNLRQRGGKITPGRGYKVADIDQLALFGVVSGFMSVLVLALYISSPEIEALYARATFLWLICPAYFLWINWIWMASKRGKMREDPILFAFKDPGSYLAGIWVLVSVLISL